MHARSANGEMIDDDGALSFVHCVVNEPGNLREVEMFERRRGRLLEIVPQELESLFGVRHTRSTLTARRTLPEVLFNHPPLYRRQTARAVKFEFPC
ncbi:MAG: hypothetical protein ABW208_16425 [Pyrinomonadaceae bacterium]